MSWSQRPLGEVIRLKRGHDLPASQRVIGEIPVISSSGITGYHNAAKAEGPGVVTGRYGTLGEVHYIEGPYWPLNTALYVEDFKGNYPRFVGYLLTTLELGEKNEAGAVPGVNRNTLHQMSVSVPDVDTQVSIATVLLKYDDLIETNRRRIALLEESARLLYREWFVNLHFQGHQQAAWQNEVPEDWRRTTLGEVADAIGGSTPSTSRADYWDGDVVWLTPTDVTRNDCLFLPNSGRKITEAGYESCSTTLLPAGTIFMTSRASIGHFAILDQPACTNQGFIAVVPKVDASRNFLLFHLMSRVDEFESKATGTTFKELSKRAFRELPLLMPSQQVLNAFEETVQPIVEQVFTLKKQLVLLMGARDALLPRLMSGAIQV